jgi:hypothetical protein
MIKLGFGDKALTTTEQVSLEEQFVNVVHHSSPHWKVIARPVRPFGPHRAALQAPRLLGA